MSHTRLEGQDVVIRICGSSGDGSIAAGTILNLAAAEMGYHVMNFDTFPAEIRGFGKSVAHTRIGRGHVLTPGNEADCLIALDDAHSIPELDKLTERGVVIYDGKPPDYHDEDAAIAGKLRPGMTGYGIPLRQLSTAATGSPRSRNIVALGAMAALFGLDLDAFRTAMARRWKRKSKAMLETNSRALDMGAQFVAESIDKSDPIDFGERQYEHDENVTMVSGNDAAARACVDAGLRLYAGYPITPATKIMEILAQQLPKKGGIVIQTEDEISAICHAIGGGFAGRRSATATSGPGLALMSEALGLAAIAEVPVVVIDSMRGGPSTGLPTKTEQSDLMYAIHGSPGDLIRPVIAPRHVRDCYDLVVHAFEVSEAFQTPVIVLLDFLLSNRLEDIVWSDGPPDNLFEDVLAEERDPSAEEPYLRYARTETGVSPRAYPGMKGLQYAATGLEHDERGRPCYTGDNHRLMNEKREEKMDTLLKQWPAPEAVGPEGELDVGIISWGSTSGAALESRNELDEAGHRVGALTPTLMWPLCADALREFSARCKTLAVAETNFRGQYADLVEWATKRDVLRICQAEAEPLPTSEIVAAVLAAVSASGGDA